MTMANNPPVDEDEISPLSSEETTMVSTPTTGRNRRSRYLKVLAPLVGALVVLTMATLTLDRPVEVSKWAFTTLFPHHHYDFFMHRRLHHPHEAAKYLACTRLLSNSDRDYDNSLTIDEFKGFTNSFADHRYSRTVGQNLPKELREIFNEYAAETEGKSNQIIDIYGSKNGERDGITAHQEELLEGLCNATSFTIDVMFKEEHEKIKAAIAGEAREGVGIHHHGPQTLAVNASFAMTLPDGMTADELNDSLETGEDPGHLRHAFANFIEGVVHKMGGNTASKTPTEEAADDAGDNSTEAVDVEETGDNSTRRTLRGSSVGDGEQLIAFDAYDEEYETGIIRRKVRRLEIMVDPSTAEIYKYVESICPGQNATTLLGGLTDTLSGLNPFGNSTEEGSTAEEAAKKCVTALGKYKIDVDEAEEEKDGGLRSIYELAESATREAIDNGDMEKELEKEPDGAMFHVEGHGMVEDDSFDPYEAVVIDDEEPEKSKSLRTVDIILISVGSALIFCLCCVLCFVELERKTRPRGTRI